MRSMKKIIHPLIALPAFALSPLAFAQASPDVAWDITEGLTTEVGHRQAGTEAEARGRDWAIAKLKALGFKNVRIENYVMPTWVRGDERARLMTPVPQKLAITALGNSGATPPGGLQGTLAVFPSLEAFIAAPDAAVRGKIVYIGHAMKPAQDGSSYGYFGGVRRQGPNLAAKKGAAAIIIRSIGTDSHRNPHTGNTNWETGVAPIPAGAISNPDADLIERLAARSTKPMYLDLLLTPRFVGEQQSGNVIAEIPGTDPAAGLVIAACHLDSWDLATGAIDDASGCGIVADGALRAAAAGPLRRTIRLLWAGSEEVGAFGAKAYWDAHKGEPHALAAESDFGADRVWRLDVKLPTGAEALKGRLASALAPLGIAASNEVAGGGVDIQPIVKSGVAVIDLQQDGTRYFDLHHTPDDTLDKIDRAQLRQNAESWGIMLRLVANAPEDLLSGQRAQ